jgi:hypothetical protein
MVIVGVVLVDAVLMAGNFYLRLRALPEQMAYKSQKLQFENVAGARVGVELSVAMSGVTVRLR